MFIKQFSDVSRHVLEKELEKALNVIETLKPVSNLVGQLQGLMKSQEETMAQIPFDLNMSRDELVRTYTRLIQETATSFSICILIEKKLQENKHE
jgi:hypothetical protein